MKKRIKVMSDTAHKRLEEEMGARRQYADLEHNDIKGLNLRVLISETPDLYIVQASQAAEFIAEVLDTHVKLNITKVGEVVGVRYKKI